MAATPVSGPIAKTKYLYAFPFNLIKIAGLSKLHIKLKYGDENKTCWRLKNLISCVAIKQGNLTWHQKT